MIMPTRTLPISPKKVADTKAGTKADAQISVTASTKAGAKAAIHTSPKACATQATALGGPTLVAVDFETSGMAAHSACAIGLARIKNGTLTEQYYHLIRPPSSRMLFTEIHGLTWADVRHAPTFAELWPDIQAFLDGSDFLLAHNATFDRRVLHACCHAADLPLSHAPFLCTLKGARASLALPSKKLNLVCEYFDIALQHHNAASDAAACAQVYLRLRELGVTDARMRVS